MKEGDSLSLGSYPGSFVDKPKTGGAAAVQRRVEVIHREADVMDSGAAFFQEPGDW